MNISLQNLGKALELVMPEEDADCAGSGESSEEPEVPVLQSSTGEHRIVDIEPAPGAPELGCPRKCFFYFRRNTEFFEKHTEFRGISRNSAVFLQ